MELAKLRVLDRLSVKDKLGLNATDVRHSNRPLGETGRGPSMRARKTVDWRYWEGDATRGVLRVNNGELMTEGFISGLCRARPRACRLSERKRVKRNSG